jgi:hypothetical protein
MEKLKFHLFINLMPRRKIIRVRVRDENASKTFNTHLQASAFALLLRSFLCYDDDYDGASSYQILI